MFCLSYQREKMLFKHHHGNHSSLGHNFTNPKLHTWGSWNCGCALELKLEGKEGYVFIYMQMYYTCNNIILILIYLYNVGEFPLFMIYYLIDRKKVLESSCKL
jgi:hypothetical protein